MMPIIILNIASAKRMYRGTHYGTMKREEQLRKYMAKTLGIDDTESRLIWHGEIPPALERLIGLK